MYRYWLGLLCLGNAVTGVMSLCTYDVTSLQVGIWGTTFPRREMPIPVPPQIYSHPAFSVTSPWPGLNTGISAWTTYPLTSCMTWVVTVAQWRNGGTRCYLKQRRSPCSRLYDLMRTQGCCTPDQCNPTPATASPACAMPPELTPSPPP